MEFNPEVIGGVAIPPGEVINGGPGEAVIEPEPLTTRQSLVYSSGNAGSGVFYAVNLYALPLFLAALNLPNVLINILSSTHSFEGTFIQPLVGTWSDRTWHARWGRRRIFILRFLPISIALLALTPFIQPIAALIPGVPLLAVQAAVFVCIFLFSVTFNIMYDPYNALLADITPQRQRGSLNSIFQAVGAIGQVVFLLLGIGLGFAGVGAEPLFVAAAIIIALVFIPSVVGIREPHNLVGIKASHHYSFRDYWHSISGDRQVTLYYATQLLLWLGINAISINLTRFGKDVLGLPDAFTLILPLILLLTTSLTYLPLIRIVNRINLKVLFLGGVVLMAGASIAAIFTQSVLLICLILAVAGVGNAAQTVASFPLLTRVAYPDQMGLFTGINTATTSISAPLSAIISGVVIDRFHFTALFPLLAVMFLLALVPLFFLNVEKSHAAQLLRQRASPTQAST
ncbi:MAG: MFS transporter [Ktedonobacterales bacterium]|nr:MFS transporter [Ktedonobacterales bacterium]